MLWLDGTYMAGCACAQWCGATVCLCRYTFTSQMIIAKRNGMGEMMEGTSEDSVQRALYIIYMRRNPMELDAQLAWEVADFQEHMMQE